MTTRSIMSTHVVTLSSTDTVADALVIMCRNQVHNMPVLDAEGRFLGLFSLRKFTQALLPKAAQLDEHRLRMHLNFMPDDSDKMLTRLQKLGKRPVTELMEKRKKLSICSPDTPLPELLNLLYESRTSLPVLVVDEVGQKVEGMVSSWDVLTKLAVNLLTGLTTEQILKGESTGSSGSEAGDD